MAHDASSDHSPAPGLRSAAVMLAALAALGAATLVDLLDGPGDARQERVAQTPAPPVTLGAFRRFPGDARYYAANRYALKDWFVTLNADVKLGLLGHSPTARVLHGRDGFLFLGDDAAIDAAQGVTPDAPSSDAAWAAHFAALGQAFEARGIPFVFILGPDKSGVYPEDLPGWLSASRAAGSRAARILAQAGASIDPAPVDTVKLLAEARARDPGLRLHHPTDTHWTEIGAALAIDAALAPLHPLGLTAPAPEASLVPGPAGDLARMIGWQDRMDDPAPTLARPDGLRCETPDGAEAVILTRDPLPIKRFRCTNLGAAPLRALVFMDSFGMAAAPRLTQLFGDVTFVWNDRLDLGLVDELRPDVTIQIMVERKLQIADPAVMLRAPTL